MVRDAPSLILDPLVHPTPPHPRGCSQPGALPEAAPCHRAGQHEARPWRPCPPLGGAGAGRSLAGGRGGSGEPTHVRQPESQSAGQLLSWGGENEGFLPILGLRLRICVAGWRTLGLLSHTFPPSSRRPSVCGSLRLLVRGHGGHRTDFTSWIGPGEYGARGRVDYEPVLFRALHFMALTCS